MAWHNRDLIRDLQKLQRLRLDAKTPEELDLIDYSIDGLETYLAWDEEFTREDIVIETDDYDDKILTREREFLTNYSVALLLVQKFNTSTDLKSYIPAKTQFTKDDILTLTHDFYMTLEDKKIKKVFIDFFNNHKKNFRLSPSSYNRVDSYFIDVPALDKGYINVTNDETIETLFKTIHEYGHMVSLYLNYSHFYDYSKVFLLETDSLFMELISANYFEKLFGRNVWKYMSTIYIVIQNIASDVLNKANVLGDKTYYPANSNYFDDEIKISEDSLYPIGYSLATEFYYLYQSDPEKTLRLYRNFVDLITDSPEDYLKEINKLGINFNEHQRDMEILIKNKIKQKNSLK